MKFMAIFAIPWALLWLLALVSHLGGNETASNALIGIPFGYVVACFMFYIITKES